MRHSPAATWLVKRFEGCRLKAYPDPGSNGDPWTIGWGATGPGIARGTVWTQKECDARLEADLARFDEGVTALIGKSATNQHQFDALVSLAFNVGLGSLRTSTLLTRHRVGDFTGAAAQFARWDKAAGHVLPGLAKRRAAEAALYRGDA